jgi:glyoxylase I family protein
MRREGKKSIMQLLRIHHAAIICSDYEVSKRFYIECLGLRMIAEHYRSERQSFKLDLALPDNSQIELFSFPNSPQRLAYPEACGLRHLALEVNDVLQWKAKLESLGIVVEPVRVDEFTNRRFVFFADPDGLPLELYESTPRESGLSLNNTELQKCERANATIVESEEKS